MSINIKDDAQIAEFISELDQLRLEVWRQGSRFNCVVLDKPPLPDRQFYRSNAEFLKACGEAVDAFMANKSRVAVCTSCDDTGDLHGMDGQWRGRCSCPAGKERLVAVLVNELVEQGKFFRRGDIDEAQFIKAVNHYVDQAMPANAEGLKP